MNVGLLFSVSSCFEFDSGDLTMQLGLLLVVSSTDVITLAAAAPLRALAMVMLAWLSTRVFRVVEWRYIWRLCWCVLVILMPAVCMVEEMIMAVVLFRRVVLRLMQAWMLCVVSVCRVVELVRLSLEIVMFRLVQVVVTLSTFVLLTVMKRIGFIDVVGISLMGRIRGTLGVSCYAEYELGECGCGAWGDEFVVGA